MSNKSNLSLIIDYRNETNNSNSNKSKLSSRICCDQLENDLNLVYSNDSFDSNKLNDQYLNHSNNSQVLLEISVKIN